MCHQFDMFTWNRALDFARELDVAAGRAFSDKGMDLMELPTELADGAGQVVLASPGSVAPVITAQGVAALTWGFSTSWSKSLVFNTRVESALGGSAFWGDALQNRRCVVPAAAFYETHATEKATSPKTGRAVKRRYRFTLAGDDPEPFFLAGVYGDGCFSVVTTQPNQSVSPVHDRMPIVMDLAEAKRWLHGGLDDVRELADRASVVLDAAPVEQERKHGAKQGRSKAAAPEEPLQFSLF